MESQKNDAKSIAPTAGSVIPASGGRPLEVNKPEPKEIEDIKETRDRNPLGGLERQIRTGSDEATIDDIFDAIGQTKTFRRPIALLDGREIEIRTLSNKRMKRIFRAARDSEGERDDIEFNYLMAWEGWVETDRGVKDKDGNFLLIRSYAVFCEIPWQIVNEIAALVLVGSMGGDSEEDIKKNAQESQSEKDGS